MTDRSNAHCAKCGDERGGPYGHETSECVYVQPESERERIRRDAAKAREEIR